MVCTGKYFGNKRNLNAIHRVSTIVNHLTIVTLPAMHYASVENLSKSFGIRNLFKNISFHVEEGDKIAFVARNGTGKSTLLKIIAGLDTADDGTVWVHKDVKVIMLQQETAFDCPHFEVRSCGTLWFNPAPFLHGLSSGQACQSGHLTSLSLLG